MLASFSLLSLNDDDTARACPLESIRWDVKLTDQVASATMQQTFLNDTSTPLEVSYNFPSLPSASISGLTARIGDGPEITAYVTNKETARKNYQEAVVSGQSALLLEQHGDDVQALKLGRLPPRTRCVVNLKMAFVCEDEDNTGSLRFALPVSIGHRYPLIASAANTCASASVCALEEASAVAQGALGPGAGTCFELKVGVVMPCRICKFGSVDSHDGRDGALATTIDPANPCCATASLSLAEPPSSEVVLRVQLAEPLASRCWVEDEDDIQADEATGRPRDRGDSAPMEAERSAEDGGGRSSCRTQVAAMAVLHPSMSTLARIFGRTPDTSAPGPPLEFIFVIDRSGSMDGSYGSSLHDGGGRASPIRRAADALQLFVHSLPPGCHFNVIGFGSTYECLFATPQPYDANTLEAASAHAQALRANLGGTELARPLEAILAREPAEGFERRVIVLTDGSVSNTQHVKDLVRRRARAVRTVLHSVGIGHAVSHGLVDGLAEAGGGTAEYVAAGERIQPIVIRQLRRAIEPPSPTLQRVEWIAEEWDVIAQAPRAECGFGDDAAMNAGDAEFEMVDVGEPAEARSDEKSAAAELRVQAEFLSTTGGGGVHSSRDDELAMPSSTPRPPELGVRCDGQRVVVAAMLPTGLRVRSLRLHFASARDGRHAHVDVPVHSVPASRGLRAAVARTLVQEVDAAISEPLSKRNAKIEAIGTALQIVTRRTSLVAVDPSGTSSSPRPLRAVSANSMARAPEQSSHVHEDLPPQPRFRGLGSHGRNPGMEDTATIYRSCGHLSQPADASRPGAGSRFGGLDSVYAEPSAKALVHVPDTLSKLVILQHFDGAWDLNEAFAAAIHREWSCVAVLPTGINPRLWATALALAYLETTHASRKDEWTLLAGKAIHWMRMAAGGTEPAPLIEDATQKLFGRGCGMDIVA